MNIKHIFGLLCLTTGLCLFQACSDVPAPYDIPAQGEADRLYGSGTLETPYTVRGAALNQNGGLAWVKAYIVGYIPQSTGDGGPSYTISDVVFSTDGASATNIVIADNPAEKDINNCMAVQLPSGDVRSALNLADHPENIGKEIMLYGTMTSYYGGSGVKSVTAAILDGQEIGDMPEEPAEAIFSETFAESLGGFTINNVSIDPGMGSTEVWAYNSYKYAQATSYINSVNYAAESWLISPVIDLTQVSAATLTFDYLARYFNTLSENITVWVTDATNESWEQLDVELQECNDWNFVKSGDIDLSAYKGKSVKIGFKYDCDEKAGTFRLKNFLIEERAAEETPDVPVPDESISVAEAIAQYDANNAQPNVRVKGFIVGYIDGMNIESGATFGNSGNVSNTNLMIADDANETDYTKCLAIQLPSGNVRDALSLQQHPENLGKEVVLLGSLEKYFGTYGLKSISEYTLDGETPSPGEEATFTKVTNVTDGTYIFAANVGGTYMVAQNVSASEPHGYLYVKEATATGNVISIAPKGMTFTLTSTADGYTIQDESGRFMYMTGTFNSCNVDADPASGQYWDIERNADGSFTITNIEKGKWMQFSEEYNSYGVYPDERGIAPCLFKMD